MRRAGPGEAGDPYVSTGHLPADDRVQALVEEAHRLVADDTDGEVSPVYPALAAADPDRCGIALVGVDGRRHLAGDAEVPFTLMSVAKPYVFALAVAERGPAEVRRRVGVNATGLPFGSAAAVERAEGGRTNPMVNAGAIATTSLLDGTSVEDVWDDLSSGLSRFAGRTLALDEETLASARATNHRNRALARLLHDAGGLDRDPDDAVEVYTRQSCLAVTAVDLAVMGATLADGGVNPITGERVVDEVAARCTLAVMATAGLYETTGDWLFDVGLPGKSGVSGGIVTVSPGKGAVGTFSPRLDAAGNSVRGQRIAAHLAQRLGLDLFASAPA